jgi:hypothetical protein
LRGDVAFIALASVGLRGPHAFSPATILLEALTRAVAFVYDNTSKVMRLVVAGTDTTTQERAELIN